MENDEINRDTPNKLQLKKYFYLNLIHFYSIKEIKTAISKYSFVFISLINIATINVWYINGTNLLCRRPDLRGNF